MFSIADYSLISVTVRRYGKDYGIKEDSIAFYFFILDLLLNLSDDEARDAITDNFFLKNYSNSPGHDRGIDAIYIDNESGHTTIHFFNFKYAIDYENTKSFLNSNEIDKIEGFLNNLMIQDQSFKKEINPMLRSKVEEIWEIFNTGNEIPKVIFHILTNYQNSFEVSEKIRFEKCIKKHTNFEPDYVLADKIVDLITKRNREQINAKIRTSNTLLFEKTDGNIRALIANFDAIEILRIITDDESMRNNPNFSDYELLKTKDIDENAFEDNVRMYLKKTSRINTNIYDSALNDDNYKFFYYNNGITLTCDRFSFAKDQRYPIVDIENLQVVNGGQTLHALFDALKTDSQKISKVNILCRLYETKDKELSSRIAEFTNSQNPVNNRDIHSIDSLQIKLEKEFDTFGLFYERKRNQFKDKPKNQRIDAEKMGQAVFAFYQEKPSEAKNEKRIIFGNSYEMIFNENLRANNALIAYRLYEFIEDEKQESKKNIIDNYEEYGFISYCTYWVLYLMHQIFTIMSIDIIEENTDSIKSLYPIIINILYEFVKKEKDKKGSLYTHGVFFKYNDVKEHWLKYIKMPEFEQKKEEIKNCLSCLFPSQDNTDGKV
jgi:hypothetical protein